MGSQLRKRGLASALLAAALLQNGAMALASDGLSSPALRFSGFATVGAVKGGNDTLGFRRDLPREGVFDGDTDWATDSLLGLQLDIWLTEQLDSVVQLVVKDRLDDAIENQVAWAFLRYRFNPEWTLRAGRIGLDVYLLSDYRNVGFSYLWARPPMEFYLPVAFDSFDGVDLTWAVPLGEGLLRTKVYGGVLNNDFELAGDIVDLKLNPSFGLAVAWESDRWQWRMTLAQNQIDGDGEYFPGLSPLAEALESVTPLWPEADQYRESLDLRKNKVNYYSTGVAFNNAPWQVQAEVAYIDSQVDVYPTLLNSYVSVGRQFGPVTLYGVLSDASSQNERIVVTPPYIPFLPMESAYLAQLGEFLQVAFDSADMDQSTLSLGMRWDVRYDTALKVQWDRSWVSQYGAGMWELQSVPDNDQILDTFTINLNVIF